MRFNSKVRKIYKLGNCLKNTINLEKKYSKIWLRFYRFRLTRLSMLNLLGLGLRVDLKTKPLKKINLRYLKIKSPYKYIQKRK